MEPYKIIVWKDLNEREISGQVLVLFWWQTKPKIDIENAIDRKGSKWYRLNTGLKYQNKPVESICLWIPLIYLNVYESRLL